MNSFLEFTCKISVQPAGINRSDIKLCTFDVYLAGQFESHFQ